MAALGSLLALGACRDAALPLAGSTPGGRLRVEQAFTALYDRYANIQHGPRYEYARHRLASTVLVPSHVFDDSSVWTRMPDSLTRQLELREFVNPAGLTEQEVADSVLPPAKLGDAKHVVRLRKLGGNDYAWDTDVTIAFGSITARDVAEGIVGLLTSAGARSDSAIRADYTAAFPRTTAVATQLFSLDSLQAVPQPDGSELIALHFTLHPERLRPRYPAFADYMKKYVGPTHYDFHMSSHAGAEYFSARSDGPPVVVRARVRGHDFLPLAGGDRPLPDSLVLSGSFSTKVRFFTIGVRHFTSDFVTGRSAHERAWTLHFGQEPDWQLPFAAAHLLNTPLKRPFQGQGMWYEVAVRDSAGAQTILSRRSHTEVHESSIMRFIGGLISRVLLDQDGAVQQQEFAFFGSVFDAMRTDFAAVLPQD